MAEYNYRSRRPQNSGQRRQTQHPQSSASSSRRQPSQSARSTRRASGHTGDVSYRRSAAQSRRPVMATGKRRIGSGGGGRMVSRRQFSAGAVGALAAVAAITVGGGVMFTKRAVACEINGAQCKAPNGSSVKALVDRGFVKPKYGNLVSVANDVLKEGEGNRYTVSVNGVDLGDKIDDYRLKSGDQLVFTDGTDITEDHESSKQHLTYTTVRAKGAGAIGYVSNWGKPGYSEVVRGKLSGKTVDRGVVEEPEDRVISYLNVEPENGQKLVAITFDDGPTHFSVEIMDALAKYNAKATFFEIGNNIKESPAIAKKLAEAGHQVACHTMDHKNLPKQTPEVVHQQLNDGFGQLANNGIKTQLFRAPYGAFGMREWEIVEDGISALVGWNLDTLDWKKPGVDTIVKRATQNMHPGAIILCHAGGGTREQTVAAVPQILEQWTNAGYTFVTIADLLASDPRFPREIIENTVKKPEGVEEPISIEEAKAAKENKKKEKKEQKA